jgi:hypothetical protein
MALDLAAEKMADEGMPTGHSIKSLYPLALAEGEGIGTAYEYYAKRRALARWLPKLGRPRNMLIAGLPEKYGSSLDFLLVAQDVSAAKVVVVDDRPQALDKVRRSLAEAQAAGELTSVHPECLRVAEMARLDELSGDFDLCLSSEVLQRMRKGSRQDYVERLCRLAPAIGLFAPNGGNASHTNLSGLSGMTLSELKDLAESAGSLVEAGYVDMPPFPPGLTRSAEQRKRAAAGLLEGLAMNGLSYYACLESYFPSAWRRSHSHIVYAFTEKKAL